MTTFRVLEGITPGPPTASANDSLPYTLGVEFTVSEPCTLTKIHIWQPSTGPISTADRTVGVWENTNGTNGDLMGTTELLSVSGSGWQTRTLTSPKSLVTGVRYVAGVFYPAGQYVATSNYFNSDIVSGPVTYLSNSNSFAGQMKFSTGSTFSFPGNTFNSANYWIDITVETGESLPLSGFVSHNGSEWVQAYGWAHNGANWVRATPAPL